MRQANGSETVVRVRAVVTVDAGPIAVEKRIVVAVTDSNKDTRSGIRQLQRIDRSGLQRFPSDFEHQPVLRIDATCFQRHDLEENRVEGFDVLEKAAPARAHLPGSSPSGAVKRLRVPAIGWNFADGIGAARK